MSTATQGKQPKRASTSPTTPQPSSYGVIRSARLDPMVGYPRYVYGGVLVRVRRGTAGLIEAADDC